MRKVIWLGISCMLAMMACGGSSNTGPTAPIIESVTDAGGAALDASGSNVTTDNDAYFIVTFSEAMADTSVTGSGHITLTCTTAGEVTLTTAVESAADYSYRVTLGSTLTVGDACELAFTADITDSNGNALAAATYDITITPTVYRKLININGASDAGTDYQVRIRVGESIDASGYDLHLEGNCTNFPNDIRFRDNDATTELSHFLESTSGSQPNQTAVFWVKVNDDLSTNQQIYVYYGGADWASASSGTDTFIKFDNFDDNLLDSMWLTDTPVGSVTEQNQQLEIAIPSGSYGDWWGGANELAPIAYTAAPSGDWAAYVTLKSYTVNYLTHAGMMLFYDRDNVYLWGRYNGNNNWFGLETILDDWSADGQGAVGYYDSTILPAYLRIRSSGPDTYYDISWDGITWNNAYDTGGTFPTNYIGFFAKNWSVNTVITAPFDDFYVRKYIYGDEPSLGIVGSEELIE